MDSITLDEYLKRYPNLYELYRKSFKYLPLQTKKIYVVKFKDNSMESEVAHVEQDKNDANTWYIMFRDDPPDELTLLHELIHIAGGGELPAYNYSIFLLYAIRLDLAPFNIFKLLEMRIDDVNQVLNSIGFKNIEDYFNTIGVLPIDIAEIDYISNGMKIRFRNDASEFDIVQTFLMEIAGKMQIIYKYGIEDPLTFEIFIRILKKARYME